MPTIFLYACLATLSQADAPTQVDDERIAFQDRVQYWVDEFDRLVHRTDVCRELTRDRTCLITAMLRIVRESQKPANIQQLSRKEAAIRVLGALRANDACNRLITEIEFESIYEGPGLRRYPASSALCNIGAPARHGILGRLRHPASQKQCEIFADILQGIDESTEVARFRLELELKKHHLNLIGWRPGMPEPDEATVSKKIGLIPMDDYTSNLRRITAIYSTKLAKSAKRP